MTDSFASHEFEAKLQRALERVRVVLAATKAQLPADVHHQYEDKYMLVENATNTAAASQLNCLAHLGLTRQQLALLRQWVRTGAVSLHFRSEECCTFLREEVRKLDSPTKSVQEISNGSLRTSLSSKVVTKVKEIIWKLEVSVELTAVRGVGAEPGDRILIWARRGHSEVKTATQSPPPHPRAKVPALDLQVGISWLLQVLVEDATSPGFRVDRSLDSCCTPRRNSDVDRAFRHFTSFSSWAFAVSDYLGMLFRIKPETNGRFDVAALSSEAVFMPVWPLMLEASVSGAAISVASSQVSEPDGARPTGLLTCLSAAACGVESNGCLLLGISDTNRLLAEEERTLAARHSELFATFPGGNGVATCEEAVAIVTLKHCGEVCQSWGGAVDYVENLLRRQIVGAIGKEVTPADFEAYMRFHNRKLFKEAYTPAPFAFAIRRSASHAPEGTVSIEEAMETNGSRAASAPISTFAARCTTASPMTFPLNASTTVSFGGVRYLHALLAHQFSNQVGAKLSLVSRARQFSSMLVLVGTIASASSFEPKHAAIVQNRDELTIPLDLSTIPSPKEFKDAIESLSAEQQAFAKAFRAMQLQSTLFGILVVQIKPQLEMVLNLVGDSLTKEIKLTQDLMQLFIKYQIPSDLLCFEGPDGAELVAASAAERVDVVKGHVRSMNEVIEQERKEEIELRKQEELYRQPIPSQAPTSEVEFETCSDECEEIMDCQPEPVFLRKKSRGFRFGRMFKSSPRPALECCHEAEACDSIPEPQEQPQQPQPDQRRSTSEGASEPSTRGPSEKHSSPSPTTGQGTRDYTQVPREMDQRFERIDIDGALRPTIITPSSTWTKRTRKALLATPCSSVLGAAEQKAEKDAAFDLLDAVTMSGALPLSHATLHVVVAAIHCFDKTVTETVVQGNVNPIEKVERSMLAMASTVHQEPVLALINEVQRSRVCAAHPLLLLDGDSEQ